MKKIIIIQLSIQQNQVDMFLNLAQTMVAESNSEKGCLTYRLLKDVNGESDFLIYEEYESEKSVEIHTASKHYKSFLNSAMPLLAQEPKIESH